MTDMLTTALTGATPSSRLQAALVAGTRPEPGHIPTLVSACATEPDFFVRDMLTWALTRHPTDLTVDPLLAELDSSVPQARSQALHTLSKIGEPRAFEAVTDGLLADEHEEVARAAWRAAVGLVPAGGEAALSRRLATQLGRGDGDLQRSLSRALAELGEAAETILAEARRSPQERVRAHAAATEALIADPELGFEEAVAEARRVVATRAAPTPGR